MAFAAPSIPDLLVILGSCAIVAMLLQRIRLAVIPGFLLTGALVGPHAFGFVSSPERLDEISHLAIVLLMFGIGLQLHIDALRHRLIRMLMSGVLSCALSVVLAIPFAVAFGLSLPAAVAVSMAFALSSTAVVLRLMTQRRELESARGRSSLAILVVQDLLVLAMLASIPALAKWAGGAGIDAADEGTIWQGIGGWQRFFLDQSLRLGGVVVLVSAFRVIAPRVLAEALRGRSLEVLTITALAAAFAFAGAVEALGFSLEMGAFLAGFLLAGTPFRDHLAAQLRPMRDVLIAVFFTTVGMQLDPEAIGASLGVIILATALLVLVKTVAVSSACWLCGSRGGDAVATGLVLSQAGEFSLVFLGLAGSAGVLGAHETTIAIAVVVLSLVVTPGLVTAGPVVARRLHAVRGAPWFRADDARGDDESVSVQPHVVIAGFGIVGRCLAENLEAQGHRCVIVELNHVTVQNELAKGRQIVFGDIADEDILDRVGVEDAHAVVLAIPDVDAVLRACRQIRRRRSDIKLLARSTLVSRALKIENAGADVVAVDELACADAMLGLALQRIPAPVSGVPTLEVLDHRAEVDAGVSNPVDLSEPPTTQPLPATRCDQDPSSDERSGHGPDRRSPGERGGEPQAHPSEPNRKPSRAACS
ncbi:MAG: cation:proton antiporter [Planctomycetes bacterium]|nr:cation:proton antiporter [Planctomycetota bacterium]